MPANTRPIQRALLSVFDKTGLVELAEALHKRGVRVLPGGDYGFAFNPMPRNARDMEHFVTLFGFTPMEAIVAGTRNGAEALGLGDVQGTLVVGRFADLVVLDDWGLAPLTDENRRDLLELLDDRHGRRATLVASQLPIDHWHTAIGEPTLADAILDRLVHNAYKITLKGESMRKRLAKSDGSRPPKTDH